MRRALLDWVPAIAWAAVLLLMSGNAGSSGVTGRLLALVIPPLSPRFEPVHFLLRKTGHVVAYGLLGWLNHRAVKRPVIAVLMAVAVASLDEWHQSYFPSRTGVPADVVIDACGATLAVLLRRATGSPETSSPVS